MWRTQGSNKRDMKVRFKPRTVFSLSLATGHSTRAQQFHRYFHESVHFHVPLYNMLFYDFFKCCGLFGFDIRYWIQYTGLHDTRRHKMIYPSLAISWRWKWNSCVLEKRNRGQINAPEEIFLKSERKENMELKSYTFRGHFKNLRKHKTTKLLQRPT